MDEGESIRVSSHATAAMELRSTLIATLVLESHDDSCCATTLLRARKTPRGPQRRRRLARLSQSNRVQKSDVAAAIETEDEMNP